jgi:hypothetical protein
MGVLNVRRCKAIYDYVNAKLEHSSPSVKQKWERKLKQYNLEDHIVFFFGESRR